MATAAAVAVAAFLFDEGKEREKKKRVYALLTVIFYYFLAFWCSADYLLFLTGLLIVLYGSQLHLCRTGILRRLLTVSFVNYYSY